jgi:Glutamine amidotransferase domain
MCGIFGASRITDSVAGILPILGWEMVERGRDAWGATNGQEVLKFAGTLLDSWYLPNWEQGIFHTRGASQGSPKKWENAHPFEFLWPDGKSVIGIHNGVISNHEELNKKYNRSFEVDSMHLWAHRAAGMSWEEMRGWGNIVWYEPNSDGVMGINFCRFNSQDLNIATLEDGEIVFCSTYLPLENAARMMGNPIKTRWRVDEYDHYQIMVDENGRDCLKRVGVLPFPHPQPITYVGGRGNYGGNQANWGTGRGGYDSWDYCYCCSQTKVDRKDRMLCYMCLQKGVEDWKKFQSGQPEGNSEKLVVVPQGGTI